MAYYTVFSLAPLLVIVAAIAGLLFDQAAVQEQITQLINNRLLAFAMALTLGFLLMVSLVASTALVALSSYLSNVLPEFNLLWPIFNFALSFALLTVLFAMMYKFVPDVKIVWGDVWFGAMITALLFTIGKFILGIYLGNSRFGSTYGVAESVIIVLAWVYHSARILLFGAEFT